MDTIEKGRYLRTAKAIDFQGYIFFIVSSYLFLGVQFLTHVAFGSRYQVCWFNKYPELVCVDGTHSTNRNG